MLALLGLRSSGSIEGRWKPEAWTAPMGVGLCVGWLLLAQSAFAVNDYFDASIDALSHPDRPIPAGSIAPRDALAIGVLAGILGVVVLAAVSFGLGLVALGYVLCSLVYSAWLKRRNGLLANVVVALLISLVPLSIGVSGVPVDRFAWISLAIFLGVFGREVLNDIEDADGDSLASRPTIPILFGKRFAFRLAAASWGCFLLASYAPFVISADARSVGFTLAILALTGLVAPIVLGLVREREEQLVRLQLATKAALCAYAVVALAVPVWFR